MIDDAWYSDQPPSGAFEAADRIHTDVTVHLGWQDRLKALFGFEINVEVRIWVQNAPGTLESRSHAWLRRFYWPWEDRGFGCAESAPPDDVERSRMEYVAGMEQRTGPLDSDLTDAIGSRLT
jgi:hypothetical protein